MGNSDLPIIISSVVIGVLVLVPVISSFFVKPLPELPPKKYATDTYPSSRASLESYDSRYSNDSTHTDGSRDSVSSTATNVILW